MKSPSETTLLPTRIPEAPDFFILQEKYMKKVLRGCRSSALKKESELFHYYRRSKDRLQDSYRGKDLFKTVPIEAAFKPSNFAMTSNTTEVVDILPRAEMFQTRPSTAPASVMSRDPSRTSSVFSTPLISARSNRIPSEAILNKPSPNASIMSPGPGSNVKIFTPALSVNHSGNGNDDFTTLPSRKNSRETSHGRPTSPKMFGRIDYEEDESTLLKSTSKLFIPTPSRMNISSAFVIDEADDADEHNHVQMIASTQIDTSQGTPLHYGSTVVIKNYFNEVVCVNQVDELRCKPVSSITDDDHIVFRIIDVMNPTNSDALTFGDHIYIQVVDDSGNEFHSDDRIIGSKVSSESSMSYIQDEQHTQFKTSDLNSDDDAEKLNTHISSNKDIVGNAYLVPIINVSFAHERNMTTQAMNKYHGKLSMNIGKWFLTNASRRSAEKLKKVSYHSKLHRVTTGDPVYIEQDMYCLGTTIPENYNKWPKYSGDLLYASSVQKTFYKSTKDAHDLSSAAAMQATADFFSGKEVKVKHSRRPSVSRDHRRHVENINIVDDEDKVSSYISLRKIALLSGRSRDPSRGSSDEDDLIIDRRCVFRFYGVESSPFHHFRIKDLNQKEKKILDIARLNLKKSMLNRKGFRRHDYKGKKIYGGESFHKVLTTVALENCYNRESDIMKERREKEMEITQSMSDLFKSVSSKI